MNKDLSISLKAKINLFIENSNGEYGRYRSWRHCYEYFQNKANRKLGNIENLALHLSMYLASWGMYRGSSFLLQHDYLYNTKAVNVLLKDTYKKMWYSDWWNFNNKNKNEILELMFGNGNIKGLVKELELCYSDNESFLINDGDNIATDTLITKILLGTMGCIPAYDRFLKDGIGYLKEYENDSILDEFKKITKQLNLHSYDKLLDIISSQEFKDICQKDYEEYYPPMKLIDMFLWETGFEISVLKYINENKDKRNCKDRLKQYKIYFKKELCQDEMQKEILIKLTEELNK